MLSFEKINEIFKSNETTELRMQIRDNAIGTLNADPIAQINLINALVTLPISLREQFFWMKFLTFIDKLYSNEDMISMSDKLFGNEKKKRENTLRVIEIIGKVETEQNLQFIVNATRSRLLGLIDTTTYFRILKAITDTLYEDLLYLSENVTKNQMFKGNICLLALERSGLAITAGIDANETVEHQNYVFTTLGKTVDRYSLSFENDERQRLYSISQGASPTFDVELETTTNEDIEKMFNENSI